MQKKSYPGLKKILFPLQKARDFLDTSGPARVLFGPAPETAAGERGRDLVDFLKQVSLFKDLAHGDLRRLARIVHERIYRDGEIIFEQGKPGAALYLVRGGVVEIVRQKTERRGSAPCHAGAARFLRGVGGGGGRGGSLDLGPGSRPGLTGGHRTFRPGCPQSQLPAPGESKFSGSWPKSSP